MGLEGKDGCRRGLDTVTQKVLCRCPFLGAAPLDRPERCKLWDRSLLPYRELADVRFGPGFKENLSI